MPMAVMGVGRRLHAASLARLVAGGQVRTGLPWQCLSIGARSSAGGSEEYPTHWVNLDPAMAKIMRFGDSHADRGGLRIAVANQWSMAWTRRRPFAKWKVGPLA